MPTQDEQLDEIIELLHNYWLEDDYDPTDVGAIEAKSALQRMLVEARLDERSILISSMNSKTELSPLSNDTRIKIRNRNRELRQQLQPKQEDK